MGDLRQFKNLEIDWDMGPEDAVALYLEWGNSGYGGSYENRVRSSTDTTNYFIVYTWDEKPRVFLVQRNSEGAKDLASITLPENVAEDFFRENGRLKGVFRVNKGVRNWLESELYN